MNTYRLNDGDTLVLSVDGGAWETITFEAGEFADIREATAEEIAKIVDRSPLVTAAVNDGGALELATRTPGGQAHLELDLAASSAAAALGLTTAQAEVRGAGLSAARLVSRNTAPFALPIGAEMKLELDGVSHDIKFTGGITADRASAAEVADVINANHPSVAHATRDERVALTSATIGFGSSLRIHPGDGPVDAAAILGFVGTAAVSRPHEAAPARIVCSGRRTAIMVVNLTGGPIELHLSSGPMLLPARETLPVPSGEMASDSLQRLVAQGQVRLVPGEHG